MVNEKRFDIPGDELRIKRFNQATVIGIENEGEVNTIEAGSSGLKDLDGSIETHKRVLRGGTVDVYHPSLYSEFAQAMKQGGLGAEAITIGVPVG